MTKPKITGKKKPHGTGKKKIEIKRIENKARRMTTFSKRRQGLFKKADEFRAKTGSKVAILVMSPAGRPYPFGDVDFVKNALNSDPNFLENDNISPPEEKEEEDGSRLGKPDWYGDKNVTDSALKYDLSLPKNIRINPPAEKEGEDGSRSGARTGGSKVDLKQWLESLDDFDLDKCDNLDRLCSLKKRLEEIEKMMLTNELSTWKLCLCNSP